MAGTYSAGTAFLQVVPSFLGVQEATKAEAARMGAQFEGSIEHAIPEGMKKGAKASTAEGAKAGEEWAGSFSSVIDKRLRAAFESLPKAKPEVDATAFDRRVAEMRVQIETLRDLHVKAEIDDGTFFAELEHIRAELRSLKNEAPRLEQFMNLDAAHQQVEALSKLHEEARRKGYMAGSSYGGAFADRVHAEITGALRDLPQINLEANATDADWAIATLVARLNELRDKSISVHMDDKEFLAELAAIRADLAELERDSTSIHLDVDLAAARERLRRLAESVGKEGRQAGEQFAGAFRDTALPRLEAALKALPTVNIDVDVTPAERALGVLRTEIEVLKDAHVNAVIDDATFLERLRYLQAQLEDLARMSPEVTVRFNATQAAAEIRRFADTTAPLEADRAGDRAGGAFDAKFREKLRAALATLPEIRINAGTEDADLAIAHVREQLATLSDAHINAELDDATALLQIEELKLRLDELAKNSPSVRVRAEAAAAAAELAGVLELAHRVDRSDPTVRVKADVDSGGLRGFIANMDQMGHAANTSGSRLGMLVALGASLGTVLVPAAAAAAVAIGGIGTAALAAVSGVGVAVLGFTGVGNAFQSLNKYQQDTAKSAAALTTSENRVAGAMDAVSSAEASLANTREQVAYASQRAAQTVTDAQRGVTDAERTALQARKDLTQAYEDARRAQEDMTSSIRSNSLAQRQANLDVAKAKKDLDAIMANPRATDAEREQARITYEQRVLQLDDITVKQKRLQADKAAADKAGIDGSTQVQSAQDKLRQATENVAKAQQRLGQTLEEQRQQERQGAFQIASAQQALANAYRQVEQASTRAGVAGGSALDNLKWSMDQIGPAGQRFAKFLFSLKGDFLSLRNTAQSGMLPGVERGIQTLLPHFASLQRFIGNVANQMGSMFEDMGRQMQLPTWQKFFGFIRDTTVPSLQGMFTVVMTVTRGLAALFLALTPFNGQMGQGLIHMAEGFAKWAETLGTNSGFQRFLGYVRENGPHVLDLLEQMAIFIGRLVAAAAPIGSVMTKGLEAVLAWINAWPMGVLEKVVGVLGSFLGVLLLMNVAMRMLKIALLVGDLFSTFAGWFKKGADAIGGFRDKLSSAREEVKTFGSGFQSMGNAVQGTTQKFMFFEGMSGRIMNSVRNGMARYAAAVTTATGEVGLLARATELAGAAMARVTGPAQAAMARYTVAVTTATGQVGLLARATELAGAAMARVVTAPATAMVERYRQAVTTASGQVSLFGRAAEVAYMEVIRAAGLLSAAQERVSLTASRMASMPAAAMARYTAGITTATGQVGLLARTTEVAGSAGAVAMERYRQAVTTASGQVSLFGRAAEVAYMEVIRAAGLLSAAQERVSLTASRMASMPAAAMARYTAAITTTTGEVGLLARAQEVVAGAARQAAAVGSSAWVRVTEAIQTAVSRTGALIAIQDLAGMTMARVGAMGSAAMSRIGSAASTAAVKADSAIFTAGKGIQGAAGLASKGLGAVAGALGGPVGIAIAAGTIAWSVYSSHVAEVKARIDSLSQALNSYANTMKGGLTPATIEQARAALEQDKSLRNLVETTRALGINNSELVRGINGEKTARDDVIKALDAEIEREKQKAKEAFGFGDWMFGFGKKEYSQHINRVNQLEEERIAFAKRNTENARAGKLTEDLTAELNAQKQMVADVGAVFSNAGASADMFKAAIGEVSTSSLDLGTKMNLLEALAVKVGRAQFDSATKAGLFRDMLNNIGQATELHGPKFETLSGMFNTIATSALGAKDKTDLLKQSLDLLYGSSMSQNEADEALIRTQGDLETQLATSSAGFDVQTASTLAQKLEIVKNRDALEAALLSTREKYVADVAAAQESDNVTLALQNARTAHDNATTSILGQIDPTYRNSAAVQDLVNRYGAIPKDVSTKYSTDESFNTLYNQLRQVAFMQAQIKEGASPERAQALWNAQENTRKGIFGPYYIPQRADGGLIDGPWQGPKADNVLIRANPREFVHQVSAVDYYGVSFMDALNRRAIPKGFLPGFAGGGLIPDQSRGQGVSADWPFKVNVAGSWSPTLQQALDIIGYRPGANAGPGELGDWIRQALMYAGVPDNWGGPLRVLVMRESGGNPRSINNYDINAQNGDPSRGLAQTIGATFNHYRDPRLSADIYDPVSNLVAALNYIKSRYGSIFNVQQADPNRPPMGYASGGLVEKKWRPKLYDDGGLLQPGWNPPIYNATGRPEPVLNPSQWDDMTAAARGGRSAGSSYHFQFRDTTLTPSKLRAMQAEDAVRAREGRAR